MNLTPDLSPHERLFAATLRLALKDTRQDRDLRLKTDAVLWLWSVAPTVAR